jgi:uncharacterized protein YbaR (Trm112 family)
LVVRVTVLCRAARCELTDASAILLLLLLLACPIVSDEIALATFDESEFATVSSALCNSSCQLRCGYVENGIPLSGVCAYHLGRQRVKHQVFVWVLENRSLSQNFAKTM